jgi:signal transduction histidine kinase
MRWRLLAVLLGVIALMLLAQDIPLAHHLRTVERDRLLAGLERDAFILAGSAQVALRGSPVDVTDLSTTIGLYRRTPDAKVVVTDASGIAVVDAGGEQGQGTSYDNRPEIAQALQGEPATGQRHSESLGYDLVYVAVPVLAGADVIGTVRITYPAEVIDERSSSKVRGLYLVGLVSLAGGAIAALFMSSSVTRPLRRLQRTTGLVAAGDFDSKADASTGPGEVRSLARAFNTMTARVAGLVEQQRSFAADASHQLRTPLTALRLQLERGAELVHVDPDGAQVAIEAAGAETERLQHLVEALLLLARAEGAPVRTEVIDVATIVAERVAIWSLLADERDVRLELHGPRSATAKAAPGAVEQIVDNYLDNALNVAPGGSLVDVRVEASDGHVDVHVADRGPGIESGQLEVAFDRFWRAADASHDGSGLGLAIVSHLALASGGLATLRNREDGGLEASVRLVRA